jgi:hypothetical protein
MRTAAVFAIVSSILSAQNPQPGAPPVPTTAQRTANVIGAAPLLAQLGTAAPATLEALALRQQITEAVVSASLDIDTVSAEILNERSELADLLAQFQARRDHDVDRLDATNAVVSYGVSGIVSNALQISSALTIPGLAVAVAAGGAGSLIYALGLRAKSGPTLRVEVAPAMLAPLFGQPSEPGCEYPPEVWAFLNTAPEGYGPQATWRELLVKQWEQEGRIESPNSPNGRAKIGFLSTSIDGRGKLSIHDIRDRMAMLADLAARVSIMKRDLAALMAWLRTMPR